MTFRIGQLAEATGLSRDTIRYYERLGLIAAAPRTDGGYRVYTEQAVRRVTVIRNAKRFGFSLATIREFMRVRDAGGAPCRRVRAAAEGRLREIDEEIQRLTEAREVMKATLVRWDERLRAVPDGAPAHLLEN